MNQAKIRTGGRIALALVAGLAVASCEREDAAGDALQKANIKLAAMTPFGTALPAGDQKVKTYNEVITSLTALKGTPTQAASASLLIAQSQMGLAEPAAAKVGELERDVLNQLSSVRSAFSHYLTYSASAEAAASYNPAKDLADIEKADKERAEQIKTEEAAKADVEKQAAALTAQARAKSDQSRAKRQQAGALHQKIVNQSATEGEQTLNQVRAITREADALDVGAAQLAAEAAKVLPKSSEIQNTIERLTTQRALLAKQRGEVARRTQASKEESARMKAEAAKAGDEIKKLVDGIMEVRGGELAEQSKKAEGGYASATTTAKRAAAELKGTAQMIIGTAQQQLGDAQFARARGLHVLSRVLESLAAAKPAMIDADKHKSRADEAKAQAKEATDAAFESYKAADAAYGASGATGETKAKLEKLNARMRELVKLAGGSDDLIPSRGEPAAETPAETPAATAAATPPAADSPQATLQAMIDIDKNGNYEASEALFLTSSDGERQALKAMMAVQPKFKKLSNAVKAKFGKSFEDMARQMGGGAGASGGLSFEGYASASDIPVTVEGDTATFTLKDGKAHTMKRKDGKWLIDMSAFGIPPEMLGMASQMMGPIGNAAEELAAEVEAGKYADAEAVMQALTQKLMQGMKPPGGG